MSLHTKSSRVSVQDSELTRITLWEAEAETGAGCTMERVVVNSTRKKGKVLREGITKLDFVGWTRKQWSPDRMEGHSAETQQGCPGDFEYLERIHSRVPNPPLCPQFPSAPNCICVSICPQSLLGKIYPQSFIPTHHLQMD